MNAFKLAWSRPITSRVWATTLPDWLSVAVIWLVSRSVSTFSPGLLTMRSMASRRLPPSGRAESRPSVLSIDLVSLVAASDQSWSSMCSTVRMVSGPPVSTRLAPVLAQPPANEESRMPAARTRVGKARFLSCSRIIAVPFALVGMFGIQCAVRLPLKRQARGSVADAALEFEAEVLALGGRGDRVDRKMLLRLDVPGRPAGHQRLDRHALIVEPLELV